MVVFRTGGIRDVASLLFVQWMPSSLTAFYSISGSGLTLDLTGSAIAVVDYGFVGFVNLLPSPAPQVVPRFERGLYTICTDSGAQFILTSAPLQQRCQHG